MQKDLFASNNRTVFTVGYEGKDIDGFLDDLMKHDIKRVVDVREVPLSRKQGFSKTSLRHKLEENGIDYIHIKALGSPSELRKKLYSDKDFEYFVEEYRKHLESCVAEIEELYRIVTERLSCLLCFERKHSDCHRNIVADRISSLNGTHLEVKHI